MSDVNPPPVPGSEPPPPQTPPPPPPQAQVSPPSPQMLPPPAQTSAPINTPKVGFLKEEAPPVPATQDEKLWGLLSVILGLVGAVLGLIIQGQSRFVKFYALQTLFFCVAMIPVMLIFGVFCFVLFFIPFVGGMIAGLLWLTLVVAMFAIVILVAIKAFNGLIARLPVIGDMAYRTAYGDATGTAQKA